MKQYLSNVLYGVLDYAAYPAAMLLAAPIVLHNLGTEAYGMWSVIAAVVSSGSILAAGFGDANIRHVSVQRGNGNHASLVAAVRALLGLNLTLAALAVLVVLLVSPLASSHIVPVVGAMQRDCMLCLQLSAALIALRAVESVCISTQRAYERYGAAVRVSMLARLVSLLAGSLLTYLLHRVSTILIVALVCNSVALAMQLRTLRQVLGVDTLRPAFDSAVTRSMLQFGANSWVLAASGIVFGQLDRIALGLWLGAAPVAAYALCTQVAQPVFGVASAGLHFLFPYLANRAGTQAPYELRHAVAIAAGCNLVFVSVAAAALQELFPCILTLLGRGSIGLHADGVFTPILWSTAILGLSVTPTYVLYAFNRISIVTTVNLGGSVLCIASMLWLGRAWGVQGVAWARLEYSIAALALYLPLLKLLRKPNLAGMPVRLCEEA